MSQLDTTDHALNILCTRCKDKFNLRLVDYEYLRKWTEPFDQTKKRPKGIKIHYVSCNIECLNCGNKFHFSSYLS